jgi:uncharacterized protein (DUF1800 family)
MRRTAPVAFLILLLALAAGLHAAKKPHSNRAPLEAQMSPDQKVLHALNRLTFGPRHDDVDAINRIGLDQWIEQQLHPDSIPENPALESKLAPLDTLRMSTADLVRKYPAPQLVKAMVAGRLPFPSDPDAHYMLQKLVARFDRKQTAGSAGPVATQPDLHSDGIEGGWQLDDAQKSILDQGKPAEQAALLESMPTREQYDVLDSLPNNKRQRLYAAATPELRRRILIFNGPVQVVNHDLTEAKLLRAVYSNRQLEEVLTDFWYNHFNVFLDKGADRYMVTSYERDVIRTHVLGHFQDLLLATAQSPAMLFYLDNWQSVGSNPAPNLNARPKARAAGLNENYGRELMELHTLGVDGGYTQQDVTEVARCFTGWTIREPRRGGSFEFNERLHDKGEKHVLGVTIPAGGGMSDGLKVIEILAHAPATAHFISKSLATRFVSDNPPDALVDRMSKRFLETDGDLREVMRVMLGSPEFWNLTNFRSKVKSPLEMVASAIRAVDGDVNFANTVTGLMNQLGEPLYRKLEPTGYSNRSTDWMSSASLLARMNFAISLTQSRIPGVTVDTAQFTGDPAQIEHRLLLTDASPNALAAIEAGLAGQQTGPMVAGLTLGSPDFQRR